MSFDKGPLPLTGLGGSSFKLPKEFGIGEDFIHLDIVYKYFLIQFAQSENLNEVGKRAPLRFGGGCKFFVDFVRYSESDCLGHYFLLLLDGIVLAHLEKLPFRSISVSLLKILSSEDQPYACGKIIRIP
jgi:hypothetical protein